MLVLAASAALCRAQVPQRSWENANRQTVRLPPKAFPELPSNVRAELERRGCTIPQVPMINGRQNVIKGEFSKPGQTDWAVLCSIDRVSSILIFWNGSNLKPADIEKTADLNHLQGWGGDKIVYDRAIKPVGAKHRGTLQRLWGRETAADRSPGHRRCIRRQSIRDPLPLSRKVAPLERSGLTVITTMTVAIKPITEIRAEKYPPEG